MIACQPLIIISMLLLLLLLLMRRWGLSGPAHS